MSDRATAEMSDRGVVGGYVAGSEERGRRETARLRASQQGRRPSRAPKQRGGCGDSAPAGDWVPGEELSYRSLIAVRVGGRPEDRPLRTTPRSPAIPMPDRMPPASPRRSIGCPPHPLDPLPTPRGGRGRDRSDAPRIPSIPFPPHGGEGRMPPPSIPSHPGEGRDRRSPRNPSIPFPPRGKGTPPPAPGWGGRGARVSGGGRSSARRPGAGWHRSSRGARGAGSPTCG